MKEWNETDRIKEYIAIMPLELKSDYIVESLSNMKYFVAPASTKYHGNYEGGLFNHSHEVTAQLLKLTNELKLSWYRPESPYIIGMFHDLCKVDNYIKDEDKRYIYNNTLFKGHGMKSVMLAATLISLTMEEIACIAYHMGAFCEKSEWNDYTNAIKQFPNVLYTHTADMITAHINNI